MLRCLNSGNADDEGFWVDILEFEFSGQLVLSLLQLLSVFDMFILGVLNLRLHRLELGKELHEGDRNRQDIQIRLGSL